MPEKEQILDEALTIACLMGHDWRGCPPEETGRCGEHDGCLNHWRDYFIAKAKDALNK